MNRVPTIILATICCFVTSELFSQSSSIRLGGASTANAVRSSSRAARVLSSTKAVNNSMSPDWRRWESILNQTFPDRFTGRQKTEDVLGELIELGLPVVLDQTAMDDSLTPDEIMELKLPKQSLGARLKQSLGEKNACIVFRSERILIISLDDAQDTEFFMTITYDVSGMGINPMSLLDVIQGSVKPDEWQDTGQGLGTIEYLSVRRKDLLVVSQTYRIHSEIRSLFNGMVGLTGTEIIASIGTRKSGFACIVLLSRKMPHFNRQPIVGNLWMGILNLSK